MLVAAAAGTILLFYLGAVMSVALLLVLVAIEIVLVVAAARFGAARLVLNFANKHGELLSLICRSFWLQKGKEFRCVLEPREAPELFKVVERLCEQLEVSKPNEVRVEMTAGAWVQMKGFRRGAGKTVLGLGYDLLAGVSVEECTGILAHEMVHAKLVRRGVRNWTSKGVARLSRMATALANRAEAFRQARRSCSLTSIFVFLADRWARRAARLVAACSRQDEFDADRGAGEICGNAVLRAALIKTEALDDITRRLSWAERLAQLRSGVGYSKWLVGLLSAHKQEDVDRAHWNVFNSYSTHPSMRDRLAELPVTAEQISTSASGMTLIAEPDSLAEKLVSTIQKTLAEQEERDSKRLRKLARKSRGRVHLGPMQSTGTIAMLVSLVGTLFFLFGGHSIGLLAFDVITGAGGFVLFKRGKYRDKLALVVPDYAVLKAADTKVKGEDWQVRQKEIETELREQHKGDKAGRNRALSFATEAYSALGRCDYLRAHVAARLAVADNQRSVEGVLASAIASAALNQHQHAAWGIARARQLAGMDAFSICWGIGWANLLFGNNEAAEVMLDQAIKKKPGSPTLHMLMSVAQARRGKMQAAIASARRACTPSAPNMEYTKTFAAFLLDAGYLREAEQQLALVQAVALKDPDVVMLNLRAALLTNNWSQADGWAETLRNSEPKTQQLIRAGELHETARRDEQAQQFYLEASGRGHYPQALLGLSRVAALKKKKEESVAHALGALNLDLPLPEDAVGPLPLFPQIMAQVMLANERVPNCEAWIATLAGSVWHAHLNGRSFMVYAVSRSMAEDYVNEMLRAFRVQSPPTQNAGIAFRMAPKEQQPLAPVYPGVQFVVG